MKNRLSTRSFALFFKMGNFKKITFFTLILAFCPFSYAGYLAPNPCPYANACQGDPKSSASPCPGTDCEPASISPNGSSVCHTTCYWYNKNNAKVCGDAYTYVDSDGNSQPFYVTNCNATNTEL